MRREEKERKKEGKKEGKKERNKGRNKETKKAGWTLTKESEGGFLKKNVIWGKKGMMLIDIQKRKQLHQQYF